MGEKKRNEELSDDALDAVSGGKKVIFQDCVVCGRSATKQGPDGKWYCPAHYDEKF